jgi:signal transduction histidine kinase
MPEGGVLKVRARKAFPRAPAPGGRSYGEVSVIDSGMGIGEEAIGKIFDPFFTTKEKGTGLGLSIAHSIVESYGGKITVQSQRGQGSVFTVVLPLAEPQAVVSAPMSPA